VTGPLFIGPVPAAAPRFTDAGYGVCSADADCITCGDVAVPLTVVTAAAGGTDALCRDDEGRRETVATDFVGPVEAGDRVLVHAGVAIEVLGRASDTAASQPGAPHPPQEPTGDRDALRR
jgi:hydrogenase maturation factor